MSYGQPSTSRLPRESMYPPAATDHLNSLEDCVTATEQCCSRLDAAISRLEPGIRDLPRLTRILENRHRYLLLPQPTLDAHRDSLSTSLAPQIDALIDRAEKAIEQGHGRRSRLAERLEILRSAPAARPPKPSLAALPRPAPGPTVHELDTAGLSVAQRRKIAIMKGRRDRLERERENLRVGLTAG